MTIQPSNRIQLIQPSPTAALLAHALELKSQGKDIISLVAGEPDFDTPSHIKQAAIKAITTGFTKYTAVDGIPELKQAIYSKFRDQNHLDFGLNQILVSSGCKQSLFNLAQALLNDHDEVIIPAPYWVSYPDIIKLAGATPVILKTDIHQRFKILPQQLQTAITNKTRLFIINSPSNPTGSVYSPDELAALAEVLLKHPQVIIATDDVYEHIIWDKPKFHNILTIEPKLYDRTIIINGVSKAYAMTGWRIGYAAGPASIIRQMKKVQSQTTTSPCSISQFAALEALNGDQTCVQDMVQAYKHRHDLVLEYLNSIKEIRCLPAQGAFYLFADISAFLNNQTNFSSDIKLVEHLLLKAGLALVPGSSFGSPGHIRLSFATSETLLKAALNRLKNTLV